MSQFEYCHLAQCNLKNLKFLILRRNLLMEDILLVAKAADDVGSVDDFCVPTFLDVCEVVLGLFEDVDFVNVVLGIVVFGEVVLAIAVSLDVDAGADTVNEYSVNERKKTKLIFHNYV